MGAFTCGVCRQDLPSGEVLCRSCALEKQVRSLPPLREEAQEKDPVGNLAVVFALLLVLWIVVSTLLGQWAS